ncbi:hypothetical protein A9Q99_24025 [Gammaproteobacteria bacterium 45_16_T64]|nr:hypothetical protein A9Q99_24025 [Gammaproteobacteria bacterium 45_16_T64]
MKKNDSGPNAVGHNSVISAVTTAIFDMFSNKGQLDALGDHERIEGKTCFITGANTGLGKSIAVDLAKRGGRIIMACRSGIPEAGEDVKRLSGNTNVEMIQVDLSDLNSVNALCDTLQNRGISIDIAVMNAGLMPLNSRRSDQGYELMFAVHFLANRLIMDRFIHDGIMQPCSNNTTQKDTPRIIFVSSEAHQSSDAINFDQFGAYVEYGLKEGLKHYGTSKLHLSTFAQELSRKLNPGYDSNSNAPVDFAIHSLCPGPIASNIARESPRFLKPILTPIMKLFFNSPDKAAEPVVLLACSEKMGYRTGVYLHMMREKNASAHATDPQQGALLWESSQRLIADFLSPTETTKPQSATTSTATPA